MVRMSTMTFDQTFETAVAIASTIMVLSGAWIVRVLLQIEKSKVVALSTVLQDDGTAGDLEFEESTSTSKHLEVETADAGAIEMAPTKYGRKEGSSEDPQSAVGSSAMPSSPPTSKPVIARKARQRQRRISWIFLNIQIASVSVLVLLTYLLLVSSNAPVFLRVVGSLCVFGVFLRYQIGDEIRRQRIDRIMLLLSLFLLIASMLSTIVYSMKTLSQGEIYEGPARIVGYDLQQYNNSKHDPTTRTDIAVSWGKDWGCPMSGGKVCQAKIQGAMCQSHPDKEQTKHKPHYDSARRRRKGRKLEDDKKEEEVEEEEEALEEDLEDEEKSNQNLEEENKSLTEENQELEKEIEELKEENEVEDEENDSLVDEENSEMNEMADEYNEDIMIVEEEMYQDEQGYVDAEYKMDEDNLEDKVEAATDDNTKEELTTELDEEKEEQAEVDEEYQEDEELLDEYADAYADAADEEYDEFENEQDTTDALEDQKDEKEEEVEETEAEINNKKSSSSSSSSSSASSSSGSDDIYEEMAEQVYDEEEEEVEEAYEEEVYEEEEEWYWDEYPDSYDDDYYEDEYWDYDWDSVWGDYACEDLFDADIGGQSYDPQTPAGGDDEWPFVNIYGSCKTCEAYVLDYFAEEAFEETQEYKQQAIVYFAGALSGFIWSLLSYIKYRVMPTAENELSLMGSDGGVMA
eukprot:jgi/Psemu1/323395/estExt_fgenesh1_pg.C_700015